MPFREVCCFSWLADVALLADATRIGSIVFEFAPEGEIGSKRLSELRNISGGIELFSAFNNGPNARKPCPNELQMRKVLPWHACVSCSMISQQ